MLRYSPEGPDTRLEEEDKDAAGCLTEDDVDGQINAQQPEQPQRDQTICLRGRL